MVKLSVITINFNNASGLKRTIESVVSQKMGNVEFIVIDGGSSDESLNVIEKYKSKIDHSISEPDNGIYHAQNKGILKAKGEYCLFLNSGDTLCENVLKEILPSLKEYDLILGNLYSGADSKLILNEAPETLTVETFVLSTVWHPSTFIKRELFSKIGMYDESLRMVADYDFFLRAVLVNNAGFTKVNKAISVFDTTGISHSPEHKSLQEDERHKVWLKYFSPVIVKAIYDKYRIERSREYQLAGSLMKFLNFFGK